MSQPQEFWNTRQAAALLGVSVQTIRRWCKDEVWGVSQGRGHGSPFRIHVKVLRKWGGVRTLEDMIYDHQLAKRAEEEEPGQQ